MNFFTILGLGVLVLITGAIGSGTNGAAMVATVIFFPAAIALYFSPSMNAHMREHPSATAITVLNLLLGWTGLGWVVALVWSYGGADARKRQVELAGQYSVLSAPPAPPVPRPELAVDAGLRDCPFCAEPIKRAALKCKHCGSMVGPDSVGT